MFLELTGLNKGRVIIGARYFVGLREHKRQIGTESEEWTAVITTSGEFKVKETPDEILKKIEDLADPRRSSIAVPIVGQIGQ